MDSTCPAGPLMSANEKRIVGFALKSRLPSMYSSREAVDAGGLMYYGADLADSYRRVAYLRGQNPEGSQACRSARRAADEVRAGDQSEDGEADRPDDSAGGARAGDQNHSDEQGMRQVQQAIVRRKMIKPKISPWLPGYCSCCYCLSDRGAADRENRPHRFPRIPALLPVWRSSWNAFRQETEQAWMD